MQPTRKPQTFKKFFNFPQINWTPKHNRWSLSTVGSTVQIAQNGRATVVLQKKPFHLAKIMTAVHKKTYQHLNFQENMFVVHDFTYGPLNFWKNMFAVHDLTKRTSNFVTILPKTPLSMNFYVWTPTLLGKNFATHNFPKKLKLRYNSPVDPRFLQKRLQLPTN
jgi:hypothetical protein